MDYSDTKKDKMVNDGSFSHGTTLTLVTFVNRLRE